MNLRIIQMNLTKNRYYFEALDNYPYCIQECVEALNYALSYNPEDADTLCLMGRLHAEVLKDYETAKAYFSEAMKYDLMNISIPHFYISCLLSNEDYEEAEKLIAYALKLKGVNKAGILLHHAVLMERKGNIKKALKIVTKAREVSFDQNMMNLLEERKKFLKGKKSKKSGKGKKKKETK
ncbi:hypothetical protein BAX95_11915 [Elizabethkingia meningoseptica]|nr:hypothetical protein BAX95_11915 [Elizabethkingia meningoseptica]